MIPILTSSTIREWKVDEATVRLFVKQQLELEYDADDCPLIDTFYHSFLQQKQLSSNLKFKILNFKQALEVLVMNE